jgi:hypothetical protein
MPARDDTLLILGGAGLVGMQCAKKVARARPPKRIVIASLFRKETREAVQTLRREFAHVEIEGYYGNLFVRGEPTPCDDRVPEPSPREFAESADHRRDIFDDTYRDFETAYRESCLARLIRLVEPDAIVDTVNTATGISYQDLFSSSFVVSRGLEEAREGDGKIGDDLATDIEKHLIAAAIPQLILHVRLLHRALSEAGCRIYLKIGTSGTGGMGLNIPYTHGEDKPSPTLMAKTATGFAHTGLLFLMARTPECPIIKEIKPAAMIGYREIDFAQVKGPQLRPAKGNGDDKVSVVRDEPYTLYECGQTSLDGSLDNEPLFDAFPPLVDGSGKSVTLTLPCVNTGENGIFTKGEFEAITSLGQMEFVTPEEIADLVELELSGSNTGRDVISAIDSSILSPSYKGGLIRGVAIEELEKLEREKGVASVAIGQLGPPQLAKYLYEAHFFRKIYGTVANVLADDDEKPRDADELSRAMHEAVLGDPLRHTITSIGIPILLPDGKTILRGPVIKIPPYNKKRHVFDLDDDAIDAYARKGWVDLRPVHMEWWLETFRKMRQTVFQRGSKWSSERLDIRSYLAEEIRIGDVVAWIFNNEIEPKGHRIK